LVIVIYESVRPQITILWRIPGTTIYRNMKQEGSGAFVPNVFIARIGSSLYFANASFVKDTLMAYIEDLQECNPTEYIVLEMTPVVSIDSTAVHVIQDVVSAFRNRGIQIAFAMVGNRVDKTFRKTKLTDFIGEQWFFPTVNEAVLFCLKQQLAKRMQRGDVDEEQPPCTRARSGNMVRSLTSGRSAIGNEVGFSNEMHHAYTTIFVHLAQDVPMITSDITAVFARNDLTVKRAQVDAFGDDDDQDEGAKHTYCVQSVKHAGKLVDAEIARLRSELEALIDKKSDAPCNSIDVQASVEVEVDVVCEV
jgi:anti-anti-sigma factor